MMSTGNSSITIITTGGLRGICAGAASGSMIGAESGGCLGGLLGVVARERDDRERGAGSDEECEEDSWHQPCAGTAREG